MFRTVIIMLQQFLTRHANVTALLSTQQQSANPFFCVSVLKPIVMHCGK
jgi:hypothetical protein